MADTTARIRAVNPELAELIHKAKGIYELAGGAVDERRAGQATSFDEKRRVLVDRMSHLSQLIDLRDGGGLPFKEHVSLKVEVLREVKSIREGLDELGEIHQKDMKRRIGRPNAEEVQARQEGFRQLRAEMEALKNKSQGLPVAATGGRSNIRTLTEDDLRSGEMLGGGGGGAAGGGGGGAGGGAAGGGRGRGGGGRGAGGGGVQREELTEEHRQKMSLIERERTKQEDRLAEIEGRVAEMKEIALSIQDELRYQQDLLDDVDKEIEKSQAKLDKTNKSLDKARKVANDRTTQTCTYLICLIILLGLATLLFNVAKRAF